MMKALVKLSLCLLGLWTTVLWAQPQRTHTVQRKETPFGIAKQHGVDLNRLFELNQWAEAGIRKGDVLILPAALPVQEEKEGPVSTAPPTPEKSSAIDVENQGDKGQTSSTEAPVNSDVVEDKTLPHARPVPPSWPSDTLHIAVMLPFSAGEDSLSRQALRLRDIALDCAAGVRLALDSGRWLGVHCDVRFLDSGLDTAGNLKFRPNELMFNGRPADILVGPLRRPSFREVGDWDEVEGAVHLVLTDLGSPVVRGATGRLFPFASARSRMAILAEHVAALHSGERVLLLTTGDIRNLEAEDGFREGWKATVKDSLSSLVEVEVTARGLGSLRDSLSDVRRNILVAPGGAASRSLAGVLQTEIQLGDTMDFLLYADGSWRDFEFLDPAFCERVRLTVVDGGGARPDSSTVAVLADSTHRDLARRMALIRGDAVGKYAWLSHDMLREVIGWTAGHGRDWSKRMANGDLLIRPSSIGPGLRYAFEWGTVYGPSSGLVNEHVRLLRQESWQWVQLNPFGRDETKQERPSNPTAPNPK